MIFLILLLVFSAPALGDGLPYPETESVASKTTDGTVWNKWETENFVILSIDYGFGDRLRSSVESDRESVCLSWGVVPSPLPVKCKIVCVPSATMLAELFSIESPRCETRGGDKSVPKEIAIWLDQGRSSCLRGFLLSVSLHDAPLYLQRGTNALASRESSDDIASLENPSFDGFFITSSALSDLDRDARFQFDRESAVLCLLARREFGSLLFSSLSRGLSPDSAMGFPDEKSFAETARRYFSNLKADLQSGRIPRSYLEP